ncbi:hypothetical protein ACLI09_14045 [Flavobacterium sp. RHBU_24]|uniref:hypothetical protein n=1 Tax=Flavobacterium sp. RHBU_24 TaxID=3391185 RepID=UPI0039847F09
MSLKLKQQHIRPAIVILAILCGVAMYVMPQYAGYFPLALFPFFALLGVKTFLVGRELYTYLERNFPEYYNRQKLFNGSVPDVWMLSEKEIRMKLDETVLGFVKKGKFYLKTAFMVFAIIPILCVSLIITKW